MNQQVKMGDLANNTVESYRRTFDQFARFLHERQIKMLRDIEPAVIDHFKTWRFDRIRPRLNSNGKSTLLLDLDHLHHAFAFAIEKELVEKHPVRYSPRHWDPDKGWPPYSRDELKALRYYAEDDMFLFLWLRWTGFRRSDAALVRWQQIDFNQKVISHVCKKNRRTAKPVISDELLQALETEHRRRTPLASEPVLLIEQVSLSRNAPGLFDHEPELPSDAFSESDLSRYGRQIFHRIRKLGRRAGVQNAHPHRFRPTFAVDALLKGAHESYVARMLGDSVETVVKHYLPFVKEAREQARGFLNSSGGLD
jgi:integrase